MSQNSIVKKVIEVSGFPELNPVQKAALDAGLLDGKNMVLAAATASGKTAVAEMAMLNAMSSGKKALYIVPLKALASEKYHDFKEKYEKSGIKVAMSIGDRDSSDSWLSGFDIIIVTSEKLDSLIRHGAEWLPSIGLVVADEVHLIDSPDRGPTLEVILTRLRQLINPQVLALSATINNYEELSEWLDAVPVKSDYRPVNLYCGTFLQGKVSWHPKKAALTLPADLPPVFEIVRDTVKKKKQSIVFVSTRRNAESLAGKLGDVLRDYLTPEERTKLAKLSHDVSHVLDRPTKQCEKLRECIQRGAVFHHAGLVSGQRKMIEDAFKSGLIKVVCATPTLAAGVNLPAYRVVVRDLKRFSSFRGMDYLPVLEVMQMCGRAGRPAFDTEGEAILIAATPDEEKKIWNQYITGESEKIVSKLGVQPVLRTHVLALVATGGVSTKSSLMDFFSRTFYAHQYKDMAALEREIDSVLDLLEGFNFIKRESSGKSGGESFGEFMSASSMVSGTDVEISATKIGRRVAELYIDPLTADHMIRSLQTMRKERRMGQMSVLRVISGCLEMKPGLSIRKKDMENDDGDTIEDFINMNNAHFIGKVPSEWDIGYEDFLREMKLVWMLSEWTEEKGEDDLFDHFGVTPGELRGRLELSDWLFYSMHEFGLLIGMQGMLGDIRKARVRVKYGIKEELLPLIKLKGVGRARSRILFNNGYRSLEKLRKAPITSLTNIVGPNIAKNIQKQLSGPVKEKPEEIQGSVEDSL